MKSEWLIKIVAVKNAMKTVGLTVVCAVVLAGMTLTGCSEESGSEAATQIIIFDEDGFLAEIREAKDIFDLGAIQDDYRNANDRSDRIDQAMKERWGEFLEGVEPIGAITDGVELVSFRYEKNQGDRYRLSFLFKAEQPLPSDYIIGVQAFVDKSNSLRLSPTANKQLGFEHWGFTPIPPTSQWQQGEYQVISSEAVADPIPYNIKVILYSKKEGPQGPLLDLGWFADMEMDEEDWLRAINSEKNILGLSELSQLYNYSPDELPVVDEALDSKWKQLLVSSGPSRPFCDGVDLLDFQYHKIGDNKYRLFYLFDVKKAIPENYRIYIHGYVDENQADMLSENANKKHNFENWSFAPSPPTSDWKSGENILITHDITAQPIPYDMKTGFYKSGGGGPGIECGLGWQASVE